MKFPKVLRLHMPDVCRTPPTRADAKYAMNLRRKLSLYDLWTTPNGLSISPGPGVYMGQCSD